jgi:hypothetical protein
MALIDLYSKRKQRQESQGKADAYQYDVIPPQFRIQVAQILQATLGCWSRYSGYSSGQDSPSSEVGNLFMDPSPRRRDCGE